MKTRFPTFLLLIVALSLGTAIVPRLTNADDTGLDILEVQTDRWPKVAVRLSVPVTAATPNGDLTADDLTVLEDGQVLPSILVSRAGDGVSAVHVVLAIDTSAESLRADRIRAVRESTKTFLSQLRPRDRAALITFGDTVSVSEPFTADRWSLAARLDSLTPAGGPRLADGLLRAVIEATSTPPGSRAVVLLSTGRNDGSDTSLNEGISAAARSGVPVYTIALGENPQLDLLRRVADETQGKLLEAPAPGDLIQAYRYVRSQVASQYEVTWTTKLKGEPGREVSVALRVREGGNLPVSITPLTYTQPPFANIAAAGSGPALIPPYVDQKPEILPQPAPPEETDLLWAGVIAGAAIALLYFAFLDKTVNQRLRDRLGARIEGVEPGLKLSRVSISPLAGMASNIMTRMLSKKTVEMTRTKLVRAGYPAEGHFRNFMAAKLLLTCLVGLYAYIILQMTEMRNAAPVMGLALGGLGFFLPNLWLGQKIEQRSKEIQRALPDALDMLSVGMSAGLSFDGTVIEVADKWHNALTEELELTIREMRLGASRHDALINLGNRTNIEDIRLLITALVQADELGTSLAATLTIQAEQLRLSRKHRAEEMAHKAAVKMLIPLVGLIFPALFVVILGPAVPRLLESLGGM